jgi:hypothetical protein
MGGGCREDNMREGAADGRRESRRWRTGDAHKREQEVVARRCTWERTGGGSKAALTGERGRGVRDVLLHDFDVGTRVSELN